MKIETELMRGAGPLAVLKLLERGEMYGYEIVEALDRRTDGVLGMGQSTLYPMLYNLESKGLIEASWKTGGGRDRKYYALTGTGRTRLASDSEQWARLTRAMGALGIGAAAESVGRVLGVRPRCAGSVAALTPGSRSETSATALL